MSGKSFVDALVEKYADSDISTSDNVFVLRNMDVAGIMGKVRIPKEMSLHRMGVTSAGDVDQIRELCCQVTGLDLTNNELTDWNEIFTLLMCTPCVSFLNLSENHLTTPLKEVGQMKFPNIRCLALNSTSIPFTTVNTLLTIMPNVEELHLCMNNYTSLLPFAPHPSITTLYLNANKLTNFEDVLTLSTSFPNLRQLLLLQNPVSCLPEPEAIQQVFHNLQCLNISETGIVSWEELEKLKHFTALSDIRMSGLPLFEDMEEKSRRQLIIGFLPNVTKLNQTYVTPEERVTAERMFIRHFNKKDFIKLQRVQELELKHGKLAPLVDILFDAESNMRTVQIHFEDSVSVRQVDIRQTVKSLKKALAEEVANMLPSKIRLYHESPAGPGGADDLAISLSRSLHTLKVEDGDLFHIVPK